MSARSSRPNDFTNKVMADVKKRPRKIGWWNLAYLTPIMVAFLLLLLPSTQQAILSIVSKEHATVSKIEDEIDEIYTIIKEIEQFEFDQETEQIISNE